MKNNDPILKQDFFTDKQISRKKMIAFSSFVLLNAAAAGSWFWLKSLPLDNGLLGGVPEPVRKVLNANENLFKTTLSPHHLAKTYPASEAVANPRVNGDIGLDADFDAATWKLAITKANGETLEVGLADIKKLPRTEIVFDFKCIEGWSEISHWGGVTFSDFMKAHQLNAEAAMQYMGMATPDNEYYVGIDMPSAMHPQTLICYEMNGKPLPAAHGYPLRLIVPVKYGVKSLKRIGSLYFDNTRPPDYWFERGYDYYSGL